MKKLFKSFALLGAIAMVFGAAAGIVSCSDGGGSSGGGGFESKTKTVAPTELVEKMGVAEADLTSVTTADIKATAEDIVDYDVTDAGLVLVSKKAGVTVLSCIIGGAEKRLTVTVAKDGTISVAAYKAGDEDKKPEEGDDDEFPAYTVAGLVKFFDTTATDWDAVGVSKPKVSGGAQDVVTVSDITVKDEQADGYPKADKFYGSSTNSGWAFSSKSAINAAANDTIFEASFTVTPSEGKTVLLKSLSGKMGCGASGNVKGCVKIGDASPIEFTAGKEVDFGGKLLNKEISAATTVKVYFIATAAVNKQIAAGIGDLVLNFKAKADDVEDTPVTSIAISPNSGLSVAAGMTLQLSATVEPDNATNPEYEWKSSDSSVATVSSKGLVTGVASGTVTISAEAKDGSGVKDEVSVEVTNAVAVESVAIQKDGSDISTLTLAVGESAELTAVVNPDDASNKEIEWVSSDATKASVSATGVVAAKAEGSTTITLKSKADETKTATLSVTVAAPEVQASYFEDLSSPTGTAWGSGWITLGDGSDHKTSSTTTFASGVKIISGTGADMKIVDKTAASNLGEDTDADFKDNKNLVTALQLAKASNGGSLVVPVKGNCTISIYYDSNKSPANGGKNGASDVRSLLAEVATGATISVDGGTAGTSAFHDVSTSTSRVAETVVFTYTGGEGEVTFTCCKLAKDETDYKKAGGACYIYGIKVEAQD